MGHDNDSGGSRAPRLPRWTRQEILVLIQGKRVAENRVRRGGGPAQIEPKWASVSGYCKRHGVNRGPVQCRKRWSNLAGDYRKIKEWELLLSSSNSSESFWVMRNDLRRERKLPGFFDREVYDILEADALTPTLLSLTPCSTNNQEPEPEPNFRTRRTDDDGLFSDFEHDAQETTSTPTATVHIPAPLPMSEQQYEPFTTKELPSEGGKIHEEQDGYNHETGDTSHEVRKRKRLSGDGGDEDTDSLQHQLIGVLEKNGQMLNAHLESQNTNSRLDREQRKDHTDSLVVVLSKLADALGRIADKL